MKMLSFPKASRESRCKLWPQFPGYIREGEWGLLAVGVGTACPVAPLPRWAGRASLPSLCPSKLAACCPSQLPRKGNECLASSGFAPLEQMVQILGFGAAKKRRSWPWGILSSDVRGLMLTSFLTHAGGFPGIYIPPCLTGVGAGGPKNRGLGYAARTGRVGRGQQRSPKKGQRGCPSLSAPFALNPLNGGLLLLSSCQCPSRPFKAATDQERDEQTGWVQEEVGGWRGDSCISQADLEPDWGLGHWVPALCLCEVALRVALLTLMPITPPFVSGTAKVPPCQCSLGGCSGSPRKAFFSRREEAGLWGREGRRPSPCCPSPKG